MLLEMTLFDVQVTSQAIAIWPHTKCHNLLKKKSAIG